MHCQISMIVIHMRTPYLVPNILFIARQNLTFCTMQNFMILAHSNSLLLVCVSKISTLITVNFGRDIHTIYCGEMVEDEIAK